MNPVVFVTRKLPEAVEERLRRDYTPRLNPEDRPYAPDELIEHSADAAAILTCATDPWPAAVIERLPDSVRAIATFSAGYEHIDLAAASARRIVVTNTPDVLTEATADIALLCLLGAARRAFEGEALIRTGRWTGWTPTQLLGVELHSAVLGIVGMGRIGQAIGRRLDASRVPVVYHSRKPAADVSYKHYPDLIEMAKAVDTLVVIVPGGAATANMINADVLKALGPRGVVINVARGSVVDEQALVAALKSGTILAAGLDVFAKEPAVPEELRAMQNVVLLPHIGSASVVTRNAMDQLVVDNLKTWFAGKAPLTPVPETPVKGR
jgi:lactate dehydrogenase-like 2-hydroxyacid dehydrogenase